MNKIFWIPKHKLSYVYYVLIVIAIARITIAAADNVLQFFIVVFFVLLVFNVIPYQIIKFFKYIVKTQDKKKSSRQKIIRIVFLIFLIVIVGLILYPKDNHQSLIYRCADAKYEEHFKDKETQNEIDTFLSFRQNTKNQDQTYGIGIKLCEEIYKMHKEKFLEEYSK